MPSGKDALKEANKAQEKSQQDRLWRESQVPARHGAKVGQFDSPDCWFDLRFIMSDRIGSGFLAGFLGGRGPGKTQLAVDVIKRACDRLLKSYYAKAMDFFLDVRATYNDERLTEREVIAHFVKYDLLVLDEIGVQAETPFENRLLVHLIDKRYDAMKDTILISNLIPEEFTKTVGRSIHERLKETGEIIVFDWPSFRPNPAEATG